MWRVNELGILGLPTSLSRTWLTLLRISRLKLPKPSRRVSFFCLCVIVAAFVTVTPRPVPHPPSFDGSPARPLVLAPFRLPHRLHSSPSRPLRSKTNPVISLLFTLAGPCGQHKRFCGGCKVCVWRATRVEAHYRQKLVCMTDRLLSKPRPLTESKPYAKEPVGGGRGHRKRARPRGSQRDSGGLPNLSATCHLNAVLQVAVIVILFRHMYIRYTFSPSLNHMLC